MFDKAKAKGTTPREDRPTNQNDGQNVSLQERGSGQEIPPPKESALQTRIAEIASEPRPRIGRRFTKSVRSSRDWRTFASSQMYGHEDETGRGSWTI